MANERCTICGFMHRQSHPHLQAQIKDKGYPTSSRNYERAHEAANKAEKAKYPKGFEEMKKYDTIATKHGDLVGKNTKSGVIDVSAKVPKKYRAEVAYHEEVEANKLRQLRNKKY